MARMGNVCMFRTVAPFVGAWIEIQKYDMLQARKLSLPSWERGLKSMSAVAMLVAVLSLPSWERGLKSQMQLM